MFKRKKGHTYSSPVIRHSQLLALEPRQVFDAAVGAAIAEVLTPANEPADAPEAAAQEHSEADSPPDSGHNSPAERQRSGPALRAPSAGTRAANTPPMFLPPDAAVATTDDPYSLGGVEVDDRDGESLTLTLTAAPGDGLFYKNAETTGHATITLTGTDINTQLNGYVFKPASGISGDVRIVYRLSDSVSTNTVEGAFNITVTKVNNAPTAAIDDSQFPSGFMSAGASGNVKGITVTDVDGDELTVTIAVDKADNADTANGSLRIGNRFGVTVENRDTDTLTLKGTAGNINALLGTLQYTTPGGIGKVNLTVTVNDGTAPEASTSKTITVNDEPTISVNPNFTGVVPEYSYHDTNPDDNKLYLGIDGIAVHDPNYPNGGDSLTVVVSLENSGLGLLYGPGAPGSGSASITLDSAKGDINTQLQNLYFLGKKNLSGDVAVKITVTDKLGGTTAFTKIVSVTPVNDAPEVTISEKSEDWMNVFEGDAGTALTLAHLGLAGGFNGIADPDTPANQVMITLKKLPEHGQLKRDGQLLGEGATFSLADVQNGAVVYEHSGAQVPTSGQLDAFTFTVDDGSGADTGGEHTVKIKLNPRNDDFSIGSENPTENGHYVFWVWERQTDAGLADAKVIDVMSKSGGLELLPGDDALENIAIEFTKLPDIGAGEIYLLENGVKTAVTASTPLTGADLKNLYFKATDAEPDAFSDAARSFSMEFTDRQHVNRNNSDFTVDITNDDPITKTVNVLVKIAPNNDDPVLEAAQQGSENDRTLIEHDASRRVEIAKEHLWVTDTDSSDDNITFTITSVSGLKKYGELILNTSGGDIALEAGDCFTMQDVKEGKLSFEYWRRGDATVRAGEGHDGRDLYDFNPSFIFTVQDGGVTSWLADSRPSNNPYLSEDYHTSHEGGIYGEDYKPDSPSLRPLEEQTFTMYLTACQRDDKDPGYTYPVIHKPAVTVDKKQAPLIYEGHKETDGKASSFTLTGAYGPGTDDVMIRIEDADTPADQLVLSLVNSPKGGHLTVFDPVTNITKRIFMGDSFTLQDLIDKKVQYVHESGECFNDKLVFAVSDGAHYVRNTTGTTNPIQLDVNIIPYNDAPSLSVADGSRLVVDEGGTLTITGSRGTTGDGAILLYYDPDNEDLVNGNPNYIHVNGMDLGPEPQSKNRNPDDFAKDALTFAITELPKKGVLEYQDANGAWQAISAADVGRFVITSDMLDNGLLRYIHNGEEPKDDDSFKIQINDNSIEAGGPKTRDGELTVNLKVRATNDAPTLDTQKVLTSTVAESDGAAGRVYLNKGNDPANWLLASDPDNTVSQIVYRITGACASGTLYRADPNDPSAPGVPLGKDSCFTQEDLDKGLIYYQHSGKNQHNDAFTFVVTDGSLYHDSGKEVTYTFAMSPENEEPKFTGMDRLSIYYKGEQDALRIWDEGAQGSGKEFIIVFDPDQDADQRGYTPASGSLNDYMELTITASNKPGYPTLDGVLSIGADGKTGTLKVDHESTDEIVLKGTRDEINKALEYLLFQATADGAEDGGHDLDSAAILHFTLNDCNNGMEQNADGSVDNTNASPHKETAVHELTIYVSTLNDTPKATNNVTVSPIEIPEDTSLKIFGDAQSSLHQLSFDDVDAFDSDTNTLRIRADHGTLSLAAADAVDGLTGSKYENGALVLTGTKDALNTALTLLTYRGNANYNGDDAVTVTYTDGGTLSGAAGSEKSTNPLSFAVKVIPVNDRPAVTLIDKNGAPETADGFDPNMDQIANGKDTPTTTITEDDHDTVNDKYTINLKGKITINDKNDFGQQQPGGLPLSRDDHDITVTISASLLYDANAKYGRFDVGGPAASGVDIDGGGTPTIKLTGTWDQVQAALDSLTYTLKNDEAGNCNNQRLNITVEVNDLHNGNPGDGDPVNPKPIPSNPATNTASANFLINVNTGNNQAPVIDGGGDLKILYEDLHLDNADDPKVSSILLSTIFKDSPIAVTDTDLFGENLRFRLEILGDGGKLLYKGNALGREDFYENIGAKKITLADLHVMLKDMKIELDKNFNGDLKLRLTVNDNGHTGVIKDTDYPAGGKTTVITDTNGKQSLETHRDWTIEVRPVNDAPQLVNDNGEFVLRAYMAMPEIPEDIADEANTGATVEELFRHHFRDPNDADAQQGTFQGILVEKNDADPKQGQWEYSDDGGKNWTRIVPTTETGGINANNALYLESTVRLRFAPTANFDGHPLIANQAGQPGHLGVRLVEKTSVSAPTASGQTHPYKPFFGTDSLTGKTLETGAVFDLSLGATEFGNVGVDFRPYTREMAYLTITVNAINDAPVIGGGEDAADLYEDLYFKPTAKNVIKLSEVFTGGNALKVDDIDCIDAKDTLKLKFDLSITSGGASLRYQNNNTPILSGEYTLTEIKNILDTVEIKLGANFNGPVTLAMTVNDNGHTGSGGGLSDSKTLTINVHQVNDAPVVVDGNGDPVTGTDPIEVAMGSVNEDVGDGDAANPGKTVHELFTPHFNDTRTDGGRPGQLGSFAGILVVGDHSNSNQGVWQYHNGVEWKAITGVAENSALYLDGGTKLRFVPKEHFNGTPGKLEARLVENTPVSVPGEEGQPPSSYQPFFTENGENGLTGKSLDVGERFNLTGDFDNVKPAFRPYTENTILLGVNVVSINDAPTIQIADAEYKMPEDGTLNLAGLTIADPDSGSDHYTLTVTASGHGRLAVDPEHASGITQNWVGDTLTISGIDFTRMKEIVEGAHIVFTPDSDFHSGENGNAKVALSFALRDAQGGSGTTAATVTVRPVNDAPRISDDTNSKAGEIVTNIFDNLGKDTPTNQLPNKTINELFSGYYHDGKDAAVSGSPSGQYAFAGVALACAGNGSGAGAWEYSINDGADWRALPPSDLANGKGFFLRADALLRFNPRGQDGPAPELKAHLLDDSNGRSGSPSASMTLTGHVGGTHDASEMTVTLKASAINDQRPAWNAATPDPITLDALEMVEDSSDHPGVTVGSIIDTRGWDLARDGLAGMLVTGTGLDAGRGVWEYFVDGDAGWKKIELAPGSGMFLNRDAKIRFTPAPDYNGAPGGLTVRLVDNGNPYTSDPHLTSGDPVPLSGVSTGIYGIYSTESRELSMVVAPVNDAPKALNDSVSLPDQTFVAGDASDAFRVDSLFGSAFSDARDRVSGNPGNALNGVFVVGSKAAPNAEGIWEYFDGGTWRQIQPDACDDENALYLENASLIRFRPVAGFTGRPGQLEVRLVETDDPDGDRAYTGPATALPANLTAGSVHNLGPSLQTDGHISGQVGLGLTVHIAAAPPVEAPVHIEDSHEKFTIQNTFTDWAQQAREWESLRFPVFERLGLDDPHVRTCGAVDGIGQEVPLIIDTHILNVSRFTTNHINRSVSQARQALYQAGSSVDRAGFALENILESLAVNRRNEARSFTAGLTDGPLPRFDSDHDDLTVNILNPEEEEGFVRPEAEDEDKAPDQAAFLRNAADSFSALWAGADGRPAGEAVPAPPGDRDLDCKMQTCSMASLLTEARAFLKSLVA